MSKEPDLVFRDVLYGSVSVPRFLAAFIRLPELVRLRGVGLSNVDSYEFKDFGGPSRWEHGIAVASLAMRCARRKGLDRRQTVHLLLAGLLHDAATPPFAHTAEYVLPNFDHELETLHLLAAQESADTWPGTPIFESELPQFAHQCAVISKEFGFSIDPETVAEMVVGEGDLGYLISGSRIWTMPTMSPGPASILVFASIPTCL